MNRSARQFLFKLLLSLLIVTPLIAQDLSKNLPAGDSKGLVRLEAKISKQKSSDPLFESLLTWDEILREAKEFSKKNEGTLVGGEALYSLGRLYERRYASRTLISSARVSAQLYSRVVEEYPSHSRADDALFHLGDLRRRVFRDDAGSRAAFFKIVDLYPKGDRYDSALRRLGLSKGEEVPQIFSQRRDLIKKRHVNRTGVWESAVAATKDKKDKSRTEAVEIPEPVSEISKIQKEVAILSEQRKEVASVKSQQKKVKKRNQKLLVVIDPGHGGVNNGAVGVGGHKEKDVVLKVSLGVRSLLESRGNVSVLLTRESDHELGLEERTAFANKVEADLFVSIHANASPKKNAQGIETYYLDNTNDRSSLKLAERENATKAKAQDDLQFIISDLIQSGKLEDSVSLAHYLQDNMVETASRRYEEVKNLGVKKAPFYVLVGAHMPCALVELAFLDHPVEGERLLTDDYQNLMVESLADGIESYFLSRKMLKITKKEN